MKRNQGYTLTEMMITVVIIGVLAAIAIPSFTSYIYRARVTEATTFLGKIKQRQESYRDEFGQYCAVNGHDWGSWNPATIPGSDPVVWTTTGNWNQLGASPDGPIRFQYATVADIPGEPVPAGTKLSPDDYWFAAQAQGDLDEDNETFTLEILSQASHIYNTASGQGGWK